MACLFDEEGDGMEKKRKFEICALIVSVAVIKFMSRENKNGCRIEVRSFYNEEQNGDMKYFLQFVICLVAEKSGGNGKKIKQNSNFEVYAIIW